MPGVKRPYRRTVRAFANGTYTGGDQRYVLHPKFAQDTDMYARGFLLLQKDLGELFEYIEPSDQNGQCYSFRIHELLLRACVEVEANCKAILKENGYRKRGNWTMSDYKKINVSHHLSSFDVELPVWQGTKKIRKPFKMWGSDGRLPWYQAYNETKHDRHIGFAKATLDHVIDAVCGVLTMLCAQISTAQYDYLMTVSGPPGDFQTVIGRYFLVRFPDDWPEEERYDFSNEWSAYLRHEDDPFQNFPYT
jgi:hypothetical protein